MKTPKGKLSRLQQNEIRIMHKYGHCVYVVDSVEQGKEILNSYEVPELSADVDKDLLKFIENLR